MNSCSRLVRCPTALHRWAQQLFIALLLLAQGCDVASRAEAAASVAAASDQPIHLTVDVRDRQGVRLQWLGDTLLGDAAQSLIDREGFRAPLAAVRRLLTGDVILANSEAPLTRIRREWGPHKPYSYRAAPASAAALADAGVRVMSLANNHSLDRGPEGLRDTQANFAAVGVLTLGAGDDVGAAQRPLLIHARGHVIAVVGFAEDYGRRSVATARRGGVSTLSPNAIRTAFQNARSAGADDVIAFVHWGDNYLPVRRAQRRMAAQFAAAGYRMVVGHGPHIVQPLDFIARMPVLYSVGNFVFGSPGRFAQSGTSGRGLSALTQMHDDGSITLTLHCILTDNAQVRFVPRSCSVEQTRALMREVHADIVMDGDAGVLALPAIGNAASGR